MEITKQRELVAKLVSIHVSNLEQMNQLHKDYELNFPNTYHFLNRAIEIALDCGRIPWNRVDSSEEASREDLFAFVALNRLRETMLTYDFSNRRDYHLPEIQSVEQYVDWLYEQIEDVRSEIQTLCR